MSEDEKAKLIGNAASEYQAAKTELAFIDAKLERVGHACGSVAQALTWNSGEHSLRIVDYHLLAGSQCIDAGDLPGFAALADLVASRDRARQRKETARQRLEALGVTCIK